MAETLTRYLKLKIADDLSADAKYNLQRIDSLGANIGSTFVSGQNDVLNILSRGDIQVIAEAASIGGSGSGGTVTIGDSSNQVAVLIEGTSFRLRCGLQLPSGSDNGNDTYLTISSTTNNTNRSLALNVDTASPTLRVADSGTIVTKDNITGDFSAGTITATFIGNLTGDVTGNATTATDLATGSILAIAKGGTGAGNKTDALVNLAPSFVVSDADKVLAINNTGTAIIWKAAGTGTLTGVTANAPLSVDNTIATVPDISISLADSTTDGYLSTTDWNIFNAKEPAITPSGNGSQYWNGNKVFATIPKADVGLGNVDNTSDIDKPISSATQNALNGKEPTLTAGTTGQYYRGDKSWQTLDTSAVAENTNLYFTNQRALDAVDTRTVKTNWLSGDSLTVTHNFNSTDVAVAMWDITSGEDVIIDSTVRNLNDIVFSIPVSASPNFRVIVTKK